MRKGTHKQFRLPRLTFKTSIKGYFKIDTDIPETEYTSKVVGLSDNWHHHRDSVRIGFRTVDEQLKAFGIFYVGGKREIKEICNIKQGKQTWFEIEIYPNKYLLTVGNTVVAFERTSKWNFLRYTLFPYWGGTEKAPKDIKIDLNIC